MTTLPPICRPPAQPGAIYCLGTDPASRSALRGKASTPTGQMYVAGMRVRCSSFTSETHAAKDRSATLRKHCNAMTIDNPWTAMPTIPAVAVLARSVYELLFPCHGSVALGHNGG